MAIFLENGEFTYSLFTFDTPLIWEPFETMLMIKVNLWGQEMAENATKWSFEDFHQSLWFLTDNHFKVHSIKDRANK